MSIPIIAIDGVAASGKSSIASKLAIRINFNLLNSGALYRVIGYLMRERDIQSDDTKAIEQIANDMKVKFIAKDGAHSVIYDNRDITDEITVKEYAEAASYVGTLPVVRSALLPIQQQYQCPPGLVAEGRDMASKVFIGAKMKILLTASLDIRAQRRYKQLNYMGISANLSALTEEIALRDKQDSNRKLAPLTKVSEAITVDTTELSMDETVELLVRKAQEQGIVLTN